MLLCCIVVGPIPVSVEETTETDSELSEEQVCAQFMKKLEEWKIVKKDREKLEGLVVHVCLSVQYSLLLL